VVGVGLALSTPSVLSEQNQPAPSPINLVATLTTSQQGASLIAETPQVAGGSGIFLYDPTQNTLTYSIMYSDLSGPAVAAHFHQGKLGVDGPIVQPICDGSSCPTGNSGTFSGTLKLTPALVATLTAGELYVNVHTALNPGGEIRGQVNPRVIPAGSDSFFSTGFFTYTIYAKFSPTGRDLTETVYFAAQNTSGDIVQRDTQDAITRNIHTEFVSMDLRGTSPTLGPLILRVGKGFNLPPSVGTVTDVQQNLDGTFKFGNSDFYINFSLEAPKAINPVTFGLGVTLQNTMSLHLVKEGGITSLPPNKSSFREGHIATPEDCQAYLEQSLANTRGIPLAMLPTDPTAIAQIIAEVKQAKHYPNVLAKACPQ
jgi:hypothetical protein